MLFPPGTIVATPGALELVEQGLDLRRYLTRHLHGDWGDLDTHDRQVNHRAVVQRLRILSAYDTPCGKLWIITEADRSVTTLLLPSEY